MIPTKSKTSPKKRQRRFASVAAVQSCSVFGPTAAISDATPVAGRYREGAGESMNQAAREQEVPADEAEHLGCLVCFDEFDREICQVFQYALEKDD